MKTDRLLAITLLLINRRKMTAAELARHFEVSERTIYRDIESIGQAGIPITALSGREGGYGVVEGYKIDKSVLSQSDLTSIITALKGLQSAVADEKIILALEKMRSILPEGKPEKETLFVYLNPMGRQNNQERIARLREAAKEHRFISFRYSDAKGSATERQLEPYAVICYGYSWYLYAFCRLRNDFRLFRMNRIKEEKVLSEYFIPRELDFEKNPWETDWNPRKWLELELKFTPDMKPRVEDYFDAAVIRTESDGSMILKTGFPEDDWFYSFLLSFGAGLEVLSPSEVRDTLFQKARDLTAVYSRSRS